MTDLTSKEQYILDHRLLGEPFKAIALDMGIGIGTVANYLHRAQVKLGARTFKGTIRKWKAYCVTNVEWRST